MACIAVLVKCLSLAFSLMLLKCCFDANVFVQGDVCAFIPGRCYVLIKHIWHQRLLSAVNYYIHYGILPTKNTSMENNLCMTLLSLNEIHI